MSEYHVTGMNEIGSVISDGALAIVRQMSWMDAPKRTKGIIF